ncbi:MAG: aromatic amino acid lyase, partial [Allorhizobium sp.]
MVQTVILDTVLTSDAIAAIAEGARLALSDTARQRIVNARAIVDALVDQGIRGYGINTGVGALCDVV